MLKIKLKAGALMAFAFTFMLTSCSNEEEIINLEENSSLEEEPSLIAKTGSTSNTTSPWDTDSSYNSKDDFQVDNDGNGAHNWNESEWDSKPSANGFNIRTYVYGDGGTAVLTCPNGSSTRRAEYRDATNIDLDKNNKQDFTFSIVDYDNKHELIMAQMHNDASGVERPYLTISAEDGKIRFKRSDNFTKGSGTTTSGTTLTYRTNDRYRIKMESSSDSRSVFCKVWNLDTGESKSKTWSFDSSWNSKDGSFYWKHGIYMPDGGSDDTAMRVESVSFSTNK